MTNLDKVLYPKAGFTKGEVIDYYARVADTMVPHLRGRPTTLKRYPDGVEGFNFFEKRSPKHRPDWVKTATVLADRAGEIDFTLVDNKPTLVWLAQLASLELHPSLAKASKIEVPSFLAFDLDPGPPAGLAECCEVAGLLNDALSALGLESFAKTSGSKGIQVYVPLNVEGVNYRQGTKRLSQALARHLESAHPELIVSQQKKELRKGKVLIDWSQNDEHKTTVGVYSLRARERPTVSTPLARSELEDGDSAELVFEADAVLERLEEHGDLFAPVVEQVQRLPEL